MWMVGAYDFLISIFLIRIIIIGPRRGTAQLSSAFLSPFIRSRRTQSRLIRIGVLCAIFSFPFGVWGQTIGPTTESQGSQAGPTASTRIEYGMPERLGRQVSPTPSAPWRSPDLRGYTSVLKSAERSPIDPEKHYELVELIDLAQRLNPETRVAWEAARQAAIGVGLVESEYFPVLTLSALGGYQSEAFPAPKNVAPNGFRARFLPPRPAGNRCRRWSAAWAPMAHCWLWESRWSRSR